MPGMRSGRRRVLTGTVWEYLKVPQKDFYDLQPAVFSDITLLR
jgi:hypothetical protein